MRSARRAGFERAADDALRLDRSGWPGRVSAKTRKRCTKDQEKRVAALKQRRDRAAAALAIDADLIAPRAALEHIAVKGDVGKDTLLPWQQQLLRGDA